MWYIGIDLGTTYSCISMMSDKDDKPFVVHNSEDKETTPSVVWYKSPGVTVVGENAKKMKKRKNIGHIEVVDGSKRHMYDANKTWHIENGTTFDVTPENVATEILGYLFHLKEVQNKLALDPEYRIVITVPAKYESYERSRVIKAAEAAGINSDWLNLLEEPNAAAISYCNEYGNFTDGNLLVYDLGGGTLDVSAINKKGNMYEVIEVDGVPNLGGRDWDRKLATAIREQYAASRRDLTAEDIENKPEYEEIERIIESEAERIKKEITNAGEFDDTIPELDGDFTFNIDEDDFNELTSSLLNTSLEYLDRVIRKCEEGKTRIGRFDIDQILLVGGSCNMNQIVDGIRGKYTKFKGRIYYQDADFSISKGATYFAKKGFLSPKAALGIKNVEEIAATDSEKIVMIPKLSHSVGTDIIGEDGVPYCDNIAKIGDKYPDKWERTYYAKVGNTGLRNLVYINDSTANRIKDPDHSSECKVLGNFNIQFGSRITRQEKALVTFYVDQSGTLHCECLCMGKKSSVDLDFKK